MNDAPKINDGGPAFPTLTDFPIYDQDGSRVESSGAYFDASTPGMTLRDFYAGMALASGKYTAYSTETIGWDCAKRSVHNHMGTAERCYAIADAMLAARGGDS